MKKAIGFDLGYTLVYLKREELYRNVLQSFGIDKAEQDIEIAFHLADKTMMREYPGVFGKDAETYYPWYAGLVNYHLGIRLPLAELWTAIKQARTKGGWHVYPWVHGVLTELSKNYRLFLISNWDHSAKDVLRRLELDHYFERILISAEIGVEKPDERIFRIALEELQLEPEQVVYVGDNYYDDCTATAKLGMDTLLINRFGQLGIEELRHPRVIRDIREIPTYFNTGVEHHVG
ncbi:HAD family hydrolase [Paenibacillus turpanensis]|uniref:HAD family hydrolase n=1 Tax=Paenibacillus turpanensis TaxID=2689078 RepID=UPI00140C17B7|nr:HAD family hydrolase [Paenibacillus turpanensis]